MIDAWNRVMTNLRIAEKGVCSRIAASISDIPAELPAMAVEQTENYEVAIDLENTENAVRSIIRIQTFSKKSRMEAREILSIACDAMRQMGYRRYFGPEPIPNVSDGMIYRMEARFRRTIGDVDEEIPVFPEE